MKRKVPTGWLLSMQKLTCDVLSLSVESVHLKGKAIISTCNFLTRSFAIKAIAEHRPALTLSPVVASLYLLYYGNWKRDLKESFGRQVKSLKMIFLITQRDLWNEAFSLSGVFLFRFWGPPVSERAILVVLLAFVIIAFKKNVLWIRKKYIILYRRYSKIFHPLALLITIPVDPIEKKRF